jgi:hypothetical protein
VNAVALDETVKHLPGCRAAIDIVTEKHLDRLLNRTSRKIQINVPKQLVEKISAAMHISNHVDASAVR